MFSHRTDFARYHVIVHMCGFLAASAHEENAIMMATGVRVGDVGVCALHPHGDVVGNEQVKNAVDAIGSHPLTTRFRHIVSDVVGRGRLFLCRQSVKDRRSHRGPLFILRFQRRARSVSQIGSGWLMMVVMISHDA